MGSIVTPLKDRIGSQILTHYPKNIEDARKITLQEAQKVDSELDITIPELILNLIERIGFAARDSEMVDEKSGVSERMSISGYENNSNAEERRHVTNNQKSITD